MQTCITSLLYAHALTKLLPCNIHEDSTWEIIDYCLHNKVLSLKFDYADLHNLLANCLLSAMQGCC